MNRIGEDLREQTRMRERERKTGAETDTNRLKFHLMPPVGWMNDPNGLCQFQGIYHVFFQYSPLDAEGGMKAWGHYVTKDFIHWKQEETPLFPDKPFDWDGVYSGSAYIDGEKMYLFYTGNVKQPGEHDYIVSGREANTVLVESEDGFRFSEKKLLMTNADYPADYTCHIRDPKVWKEGNTLYMVQGGRRKGDEGTILLFEGTTPHDFRVIKEIRMKNEFGYMWECPDYFLLDGIPVLAFSPQGLESGEFHCQNIYQSGYLILKEKITGRRQKPGNIEYGMTKEEKNADNLQGNGQSGTEVMYIEGGFREWDFGFDFYAPQTFSDEKGRRILIGWAGIPDAEYDNEPTVKNGWQHALTLPRELFLENGQIYQRPIAEIRNLRKEESPLAFLTEIKTTENIFELEIDFGEKREGKKEIRLCCGTEFIQLSWQTGVLALTLSEEAGRGRKKRKMKLGVLEHLQVFVDTSMLEVYVNRGKEVMTTRFYFPSEERLLFIEGGEKAKMWKLKELQVNFLR